MALVAVETIILSALLPSISYDDYVATNDEARALTAELINIKQKRH